MTLDIKDRPPTEPLTAGQRRQCTAIADAFQAIADQMRAAVTVGDLHAVEQAVDHLDESIDGLDEVADA